MLAIRGHDYGTAPYLDVQVTYDVPTYEVCPLFDQTKAFRSGSTAPLKIQLCDAAGGNKSASSIVVHATGLERIDTSTSSTVEDAGNANPEDDFRYDPTLGETGGYIFNLSTTGLASGTWKLTFTVDGLPASDYYVTFDVK